MNVLVYRGKILPQLINAFEFSNAGSAILGPVFKIGKSLNTQVSITLTIHYFFNLI